jgi:hypothetical protein
MSTSDWPSAKSLCEWAADRFSATCGCASAKRRNRGTSQRLAMLGAECTYTLLLTPWRRSSVAVEMAASAPPMRARYCSPARLRRTPWALRSNSRTPRSASSREI